MKFNELRSRAVSLIVLTAFISLLHGGPAPARTASAGDDSRARLELGDGGTPGSFEAEGAAPAAAGKKKRFPWLAAGLGAVAIGIAVYFLVNKKTRFTLTIFLAPGVLGTPQATARYKKGEVVAYSYEPGPKYGNLRVMLDGRTVPASGSITMDKDHVLTFNTAKGATLLVNSTPPGAKIYLDGEDSGFLTPHDFIYPAQTTKFILLRHQCGTQELGREITTRLGYSIMLDAALAPGISEEFSIPLSPCWQMRDPSGWSIDSGLLMTAAPARGYQFALYRYGFPRDFSVSARLRLGRVTEAGTAGIVLSTHQNMADSQGYEFSLYGERKFVIYKNNHYDHFKDMGIWKFIKLPTYCPHRIQGGGAWNTLRIVKAGANYTFYVNDKFVYSFTDTLHDVRYITLGIWDQGMLAEFDWVLLEPGNAAGSVPGPRPDDFQEMQGGRLSTR